MAKTLDAVLVGCGNMSNAWLEAAKRIPQVRMVGLVDLNPEMARKRAAEHGLDVATGSDLKQMLDKIRPGAVFDCTIPEAHMMVTLEALKRGCHVLGEKPLSDSMAHARKTVAAALKAGKLYAVIQNRRYDPRIHSIRRAISQIGKPTTLTSDFFLGPRFGGFRDQMKHVLLLDMAIHTFDAARFLLKADPVSVYAHEWNPAGSWYKHGASAIAVFEMTGGLVYTYRGSWAADGMPTSWEAEWRIVGQKGTLRWDGGEKIEGQAVAEKGGFLPKYRDLDIPLPADDGLTGHFRIMREFVGKVLSGKGKPPETICTDNIKSLAMVFGAIRSAETGRKVQIAPLLGRFARG